MANFPDFTTSPAPCALAIFCRAPRLGTVKTRLAASHGDRFALGLYRAMLADTLELGLALAPEIETFAVFTPPDALSDKSLSSLWDGQALAQCEGDLGDRMLGCFAQLRSKGYERIVLIGSDSPDMPLETLAHGFEELKNSDFVIGSSDDGGFYLIGASVAPPATIFEGIVWSSKSVYPRLIENLGKLTPPPLLSLLPAWRDVDDDADLMDLQRRLLKKVSIAPRTHTFLGENNIDLTSPRHAA